MSTDLTQITRVFSLGGMSEYGKSEAGRVLDTAGVKRLKIARFIETIAVARGYDISHDTFTDHLFENDSQGTLAEFFDLVVTFMKEQGHSYSSLESMYRVPMATFLKQALGGRMVNIYIEVPFEVRVRREWIRRGRSVSLKNVERKVIEKDEKKARIGVPDLREVADVVIDNSGTLDEYKAHLSKILKQYCPDLVA